MRKWVILGVGVAGVLILVVLVTLISNLNRILAAAIEEHGSSATGTEVSVAGVDVSLRDGSGGIDALRIANPSGYQAKDAFRLAGVHIDVDLESVRKDPIVIERIEIAAPEVFAEFQKDGGSNLAQIKQHLDRFVPKSEGSGDSATDSKSSEQKRIRIEELTFSEGQIALDASALGIEARSVKLPSFRLRNLGGADGGTAPELAKEILSEIVAKSLNEVGRSEMSRRIDELLGHTSEGAKKLLDKIRN